MLQGVGKVSKHVKIKDINKINEAALQYYIDKQWDWILNWTGTSYSPLLPEEQRLTKDFEALSGRSFPGAHVGQGRSIRPS